MSLCLGGPLAFGQEVATLFGTDGDDSLTGTAQSESIYARAGNDRVDGGAGDDELDGGPGADVLGGGDGEDVVSYPDQTAVTVSLDRIANDGSPGEGDNVGADVEDIFGTNGDDKLTGVEGANTLDGAAGDDRLDAGKGSDALFGGEGTDTINARDGELDTIDCGAGTDTAVVDAIDVTTGCEQRETPPSTPVFRVAKLMPSGRRIAAIRLTGINPRSSVVIGCVAGCRPATTRAVLRRQSLTPLSGAVKIMLPHSPRLVGGTTFEVAVAAPGARARCFVFRLGSRLTKFKRLRGQRCTSVAKPHPAARQR